MGLVQARLVTGKRLAARMKSKSRQLCRVARLPPSYRTIILSGKGCLEVTHGRCMVTPSFTPIGCLYAEFVVRHAYKLRSLSLVAVFGRRGSGGVVALQAGPVRRP